MIFQLIDFLRVFITAYRSINVVNLKHKSYIDINIPLEGRFSVNTSILKSKSTVLPDITQVRHKVQNSTQYKYRQDAAL